MKVWVLTIGDYSYMRVLGVFDDEHKARAEQIAEWMGGAVEGLMEHNCTEEPFVLNHYEHDTPPEGMRFWRGCLYKDGSFHHFVEDCVLTDEGELQPVHTELDCPETNEMTRKYERASYWRLYISLYAENEEKAKEEMLRIHSQTLKGD